MKIKVMNYRKLSKVTDNIKIKDAEEWVDLYGGIDDHIIGKVSPDHTKFKPSLGHFMDGDEFENLFGDYPDGESEESKKGFETLAKKWKVSVDQVIDGSNDRYDYVYAVSDKLGNAIDIEPAYVELEDDGRLWVSWENEGPDGILNAVLNEYPKTKIWWQGVIYDY